MALTPVLCLSDEKMTKQKCSDITRSVPPTILLVVLQDVGDILLIVKQESDPNRQKQLTLTP